jgi:hypothetical protein
MDRITKILVAAGGALIGAAVVQQLRLPPAERTWQGRVAGVPYDFRPPTVERLRASFWNPEDPSLVTPRVFGVGWSINLYRLLRPRAS